MGSKFVIINNGMTDLRGHYFETAMSIADEARRRGFSTAMAAHVTCDARSIPDGIEFYPVFRVDHWGGKIAGDVPELFGLRGSLKALRGTTIEDVLANRATMQEYLLSRFDPLPGTSSQQSFPPVSPSALGPPAGTRSRLKHVAKRALPPIVAGALRWMVRHRLWVKKAVRCWTPPFLLDRMKRAWRSRHSLIEPTCTTPVAAAPASRESRTETNLRNALSRLNAGNEADLWPLFHRDLERLLCLTDVGPGDHVFLPTAHGREAYAVRRLIDEIGEEQSPLFHLEFRHGIATLEELESREQPASNDDYTRIHQAYFDACRSFAETDRMRCYTDTDELSIDYAHLSGFEFRVLPIPFRTELIPPSADRGQGPLKVLFLGDVREEKGFPLLPGLVRALFDDYVKTGKLRFMIQASLHRDEPWKVLRDALKELEGYGTEHVKLFGRDGFVPPEEYYSLLAGSDVVLCPYQANSYRARSSGIFSEAVAAGKPTIVPAGTWLAHQQWPGSGEVFTDEASFANALRSLCDGYREYRERALRGKDRWLRSHSPGRLVDCLVGPEEMSRATAA